jgi:uncharacterized protein YdaU (DUF1376 family)
MTNPYFPMYASDWLAGTRSLTAAETGIYITIICMMYEKGGPIEMPRRRLARLCGTTAPALNRALDVLIEAGKLDQYGEKLSNVRAMLEIEKRADKTRSSRDNANARWSKSQAKSTEAPCGRIESAYANDMRETCYPEPEPDIKERVTKVTPKKVSVEDPLFDRFWSLYPRKVSKSGAQKAWKAATKKIDPLVIIEGLELHLQDLIEKPKQFIPHAATWLNEERWADELEQVGDSFWDTFTWENPK